MYKYRIRQPFDNAVSQQAGLVPVGVYHLRLKLRQQSNKKHSRPDAAERVGAAAEFLHPKKPVAARSRPGPQRAISITIPTRDQNNLVTSSVQLLAGFHDPLRRRARLEIFNNMADLHGRSAPSSAILKNNGISAGSRFPPDRTTPIFELAGIGTAPDINAATPTQPDGSTTSFAR